MKPAHNNITATFLYRSDLIKYHYVKPRSPFLRTKVLSSLKINHVTPTSFLAQVQFFSNLYPTWYGCSDIDRSENIALRQAMDKQYPWYNILASWLQDMPIRALWDDYHSSQAKQEFVVIHFNNTTSWYSIEQVRYFLLVMKSEQKVFWPYSLMLQKDPNFKYSKLKLLSWNT